jgi:hypothetical protein
MPAHPFTSHPDPLLTKALVILGGKFIVSGERNEVDSLAGAADECGTLKTTGKKAVEQWG